MAALVRSIELGGQSFWYDESFTVRIVQGPLDGLIDRLSATESTPPLHYLLTSGWRHLAGSSEAGLRSLSLLCGVALVPVVFAIGQRVAGNRAALLAAALVATNPELIWMSQEARSYALLVLLLMAGVLAFLWVLERASPARMAAWAVLSAAGLATHYFAVFLVIPQMVWLLVRLRGRALVAALVVLGTAAALVPLVLDQRETSAGLATGGESLTTRLPAVPKNWLAAESASQFDYWWAVGVMGAIVAAGLLLAAIWTRADERGSLTLIAGLAACAILVPLAGAVAGIDYVNARNLLGAWPLILVLVAAGLTVQRARVAGPAAGVVLCIAGLGVAAAIATTDRLQRDDWRAAARVLDKRPEPGVIILNPGGGSAPLSLYKDLTPIGGAEVRTRLIDVMELTRPGDRPTFVPQAPFTPTATTSSASFRIVRYTAPRPQKVSAIGNALVAASQGVPAPETVLP